MLFASCYRLLFDSKMDCGGKYEVRYTTRSMWPCVGVSSCSCSRCAPSLFLDERQKAREKWGRGKQAPNPIGRVF